MQSTFLGSVHATYDLKTDGIKKGVDQATKEFERMEKVGNAKLKSIGQGMEKAGKKATMYLTVPILALGAAAVKVSMDFEQSLLNAFSVMGDVSDEARQKLRLLAEQLGKDTAFKASEAAEAMYFLASAGLNVKQTMGALPGVLDLAAATQSDLSFATEMVVNQLGKFGIAAEDSTRIADVFAKGIGSSQLTLERLEKFLPFAGAAAAQFNTPLEETVAIGAVLSKVMGDKMGMAGAGLQMMFQKLIAPTESINKAFGRLGVSANSVNPAAVGMTDAIRNLINAFDGVEDPIERARLAQELFGERGVRVFTFLQKAGVGALDDMVDSMYDVQGVSKEMADIQLSGLKGAITILGSSLENLMIQFEKLVDPYLKKAVNAFKNMANTFADLDDDTKVLIMAVLGLVAALGPLLLIAGKVIQTMAFMKMAGFAVVKSFGAVSLAIMGWVVVIAVAVLAIAAILRSITSWTKEQNRATQSQGKAEEMQMRLNAAQRKAAKEGISVADAYRQLAGSAEDSADAVSDGADVSEVAMGGVGDAAGDMADDHGAATDQMREDIEKLDRDYEKSSEKRTETFEESMSELVLSHKEAIADLKEDINDEKENFTEAQADKLATFNELMADMTENHQEKIDGIKENIADEMEYFNDSMDEKKERYTEDLIDYKKSHTDRLDDLKDSLDEEVALGEDANADKIADLKESIAEENTEYADKVAKRVKEYDDDVIKDTKAHDKKISKLETSLGKADIEYKKDVDKRTANYDEDVVNDKERYDDKMGQLNTSLSNEEKIVKDNAAEFDKFKDHTKGTDIQRLKDQFDEEEKEAKESYEEKLKEITEGSDAMGGAIESGLGGGWDAGVEGAEISMDEMLADIDANIPEFEDMGSQAGTGFMDKLIEGWGGGTADFLRNIADFTQRIRSYIWNNLVLGALDWGAEMINKFIMGIGKGIMSLGEGLAQVGIIIWDKIIEWKDDALKGGKDLLDSFGSGIWNKITALAGTVDKIWTTVWDGLKGMISDAWNWGKDMIQNFVDGIKEKIAKIGETAKGVADIIKDILGFSIPKEGPMKHADKWMPDMMDLMTKTLIKSQPGLISAAQALAGGLSGAFSMNPVISGGISAKGGKTASPSQISVVINNPVISSELDADQVFAEGARRLELAYKGIQK